VAEALGIRVAEVAKALQIGRRENNV